MIIIKRLYVKKSSIKKGAGRPSMRIGGRPRCPSQIAPTQNAQYRGMQEKLNEIRNVYFPILWQKFFV